MWKDPEHHPKKERKKEWICKHGPNQNRIRECWWAPCCRWRWLRTRWPTIPEPQLSRDSILLSLSLLLLQLQLQHQNSFKNSQDSLQAEFPKHRIMLHFTMFHTLRPLSFSDSQQVMMSLNPLKMSLQRNGRQALSWKPPRWSNAPGNYSKFQIPSSYVISKPPPPLKMSLQLKTSMHQPFRFQPESPVS